MEKNIKSFDELTQKLREDASREFYIDTSLREETPLFIGFPVHFSYAPIVSVRTISEIYTLNGESQESPDNELIRCRTRAKALELGLTIAEKLVSTSRQPTSTNRVKVNDLPINEAKNQFETYKAEITKLEEAHKNWRYK